MADKFIFVRRVRRYDEYYMVKVKEGVPDIISKVIESGYPFDNAPFDTDIHQDKFEISTTLPTEQEMEAAIKYDDFIDLTEQPCTSSAPTAQ